MLFLPKNFPNNQALYNYVFGYNETHIGLVLDYGSLFNHHESANAEATRVTGSGNIDFYVRRASARVRVAIRARA